MIKTTCKSSSSSVIVLLSQTQPLLLIATHRSGIAVGLASTSRLLGGAIATAIYTAILNNKYASTVGEKLSQQVSGFAAMPALVAAAKLNTAAAYAKVPGITPAITASAGLAAKLAWVDSFKLVWYVALGFGALSIMAACCTKSINPDMMNNNRAVVLENEKKRETDLEKKVAGLE